MHAQRTPALRIHEDIHSVLGTGVHIAEHPARLVRTDGDEAEVERPAVHANLREGRADGEVGEGGRVVISVRGKVRRDGAVACVAVKTLALLFL